jgi:nitrile hydratase subunit beta
VKLQHHLGGLEGLDSPIQFEKRVFVQEWETRIFGLHTAMMALSDSLRDAVPDYDMDAVPSTFSTTWTWADLRKGAEAMNPFAYFQYRYYEKWLGGITAYLLEHGYLTQEELDAAARRFHEDPAAPLPPAESPPVDDQVVRYLREGDSPRRGPADPAFAVGDSVTVRNPPAAAHTRLPGYLRGCRRSERAPAALQQHVVPPQRTHARGEQGEERGRAGPAPSRARVRRSGCRGRRRAARHPSSGRAARGSPCTPSPPAAAAARRPPGRRAARRGGEGGRRGANSESQRA